MARKHRPALTDTASSVMPSDLLIRRGLSAASFARQIRDRNEWLRAHGINPGDWSQVYPVLLASWAAHDLPSASERARRRLAPKGEPK